MSFIDNLFACFYYLKNPSQVFTKELRTLIVVSSVGLAQGLIFSCDVVFSYIYRDDYLLEPSQSSFFDATNQIPWMIKPLWGVLSDNYRFLGYKRKSYLIAMAVLGWLCFLTFGVSVPPLILAFFVLFFSNIALSFTNCMAEAILVEDAQDFGRNNNASEIEKVKAASRGVSIFFGAKYFGRILGAFLIMCFLQEAQRQRYIFAASFVPFILMIISFILPESKKRKEEKKLVQPQIQMSDQPPTSTNNFNDNEECLHEFNSSNLKKATDFIKNPYIYKSMMLLFICNFIPQSPQVKFYYYTKNLGFDTQFIGSLKFITYIAVLSAIIIYNRYLKNVELRYFYTGTAIIGCILTLSQLILIFRLNLKIGIPDQVFTVFDTFILELILEFNALPMLVLACRLCPKDIEATIFALFMAIGNAGYLTSLQMGALFTHLLGIKSTDFDNLWIFTLITATFYLIPLIALWTIKFEKAIEHVEESEKNEEEIDKKEVIAREGATDEQLNNMILTEEKTKEESSQLHSMKQQMFNELAWDEGLNVFS